VLPPPPRDGAQLRAYQAQFGSAPVPSQLPSAGQDLPRPGPKPKPRGRKPRNVKNRRPSVLRPAASHERRRSQGVEKRLGTDPLGADPGPRLD